MRTECQVCMHKCNINQGQLGRCRARGNVDGKIIAVNYGKITSMALDPIEKKPLYHFFPGSKILSVGSYGCNLNCQFCQNYSISMVNEDDVDTVTISPKELADKANALKDRGNVGVAFTYNEPLISYEFIRDTALLLSDYNMKVVVVTNGSVTNSTANEILPYIDALNIDLKGFTNHFYSKHGGDLETVKDFIKLAATKCHIEITTLIIPMENDSVEEMRELSQWVASIDENIPLHISRFFPTWKMQDRGPTDVQKVYDLANVARENLNYVYEGNC